MEPNGLRASIFGRESCPRFDFRWVSQSLDATPKKSTTRALVRQHHTNETPAEHISSPLLPTSAST